MNGANKPLITKVVLTVDTEPSIAGAFGANPAHTPLLHELIACEVKGKSEGLGFLIETLAGHGLVATFFVETAHTRYFGDRDMGGYVASLMQAGQDVQIHLHPCWLSFEKGQLVANRRRSDSCEEIEVEELARLIAAGSEQIAKWTGKPPSAMRTGNCSAALSVFEAMRWAGLRHSSNICLGVAPPREAALAIAGGVRDFAGIRELPVTCFTDSGPVGRGGLRPMQITALSSREMIALLCAAHDCGAPVVVILTHPFEFVKKRDFRYTGLRANRIVQRRFRRLCGFLAENSDRFEVLPIGPAADALEASSPWVGLRGNWLSAIFRAVENTVNDRL